MADREKEYARANRSDYFATRLRNQNASTAQKDPSRKTRSEKFVALHEHTVG